MKENILARLEDLDLKSAWKRGVREYAEEFVEFLDDEGFLTGYTAENLGKLKTDVLNGADDFRQYSYGGCSLIYDGDIAERLCTPREFKAKHEGEKAPNPRENWLDVQARALNDAYFMVIDVIYEEVK